MSEQINENAVSSFDEHCYMMGSCLDGQLYTVQSGDTMFTIARSYNISLQDLIDANPQISDPNMIYPGERLCIPVDDADVSCPEGQIYQVAPGDTMYEIARRYQVNLDELVNANPQIADPAQIFPGQTICIPGNTSPRCQGGVLYTVQSCDTMFEIARSYNMSLADLITANPQITNPDRIFPGQVICIPPTMPQPVPLPMPLPGPPAGQLPITAPDGPPPPTSPTLPMPSIPPGAQPCPPAYGQMPVYTMPIYVMVPWDEGPFCYKKRDRRGWRCR